MLKHTSRAQKRKRGNGKATADKPNKAAPPTSIDTAIVHIDDAPTLAPPADDVRGLDIPGFLDRRSEMPTPDAEQLPEKEFPVDEMPQREAVIEPSNETIEPDASRLLDYDALRERCLGSSCRIGRLIENHGFPQPQRHGRKKVWHGAEVAAWIEAHPDKVDRPKAAKRPSKTARTEGAVAQDSLSPIAEIIRQVARSCRKTLASARVAEAWLAIGEHLARLHDQLAKVTPRGDNAHIGWNEAFDQIIDGRKAFPFTRVMADKYIAVYRFFEESALSEKTIIGLPASFRALEAIKNARLTAEQISNAVEADIFNPFSDSTQIEAHARSLTEHGLLPQPDAKSDNHDDVGDDTEEQTHEEDKEARWFEDLLRRASKAAGDAAWHGEWRRFDIDAGTVAAVKEPAEAWAKALRIRRSNSS